MITGRKGIGNVISRGATLSRTLPKNAATRQTAKEKLIKHKDEIVIILGDTHTLYQAKATDCTE